MKTQHICALCGDVMYETGGKLSVLGKFVAAFLIGLVFCIAMPLTGITSRSDLLVAGLIATLINAAVIYGIFTVCRKFVRKIIKK